MAEHIDDLGHGVKVKEGLGEGPTVTSTELCLGWRPTVGQFVGTAVTWHDRLFEVRSVERSDDGERWRLVPWPDGEVARNIDRLDADWIEILVGDSAVIKKSRSLRFILVLVSPVAGLITALPQLSRASSSL